jgi:hypothetical protein
MRRSRSLSTLAIPLLTDRKIINDNGRWRICATTHDDTSGIARTLHPTTFAVATSKSGALCPCFNHAILPHPVYLRL